jgi:hypothetical protein
MKRSYLVLGFFIWSISLGTAYFVGLNRQLSDSGTTSSRANAADIINPTETPNSDLEEADAESKTANDASSIVTSFLKGDFTLDTALAQVSNLNENEARNFLIEAFALPQSDPHRSRFINSLLRQLAQSAPQEALQLANQIGSHRDTERAKAAILEVWGKNDPIAALMWAQTTLVNEPTNLRNSQMRAIFRGYAETNPQAAFQSAQAMKEDTRAAARLKTTLMEEVIEAQVRSGDLANAKLTIELLEDGDIKSRLLGELVNEWASFDPANAATYVNKLGEDATTRIKTTLVSEWAESDPVAAAAWLNQLTEDDPAIARAASEIIREWTRYDLNASAEWLNSLPASPELDRAIASYTQRAAQEDPATAMTWAESVSNDWMRSRLMENVAGNWKSEDPAGFEQYLESSDFSVEEKEILKTTQGGGGRRRGPFGRPPRQ